MARLGIIKDKEICEALGLETIELDEGTVVGFLPLMNQTEIILFEALIKAYSSESLV